MFAHLYETKHESESRESGQILVETQNRMESK